MVFVGLPKGIGEEDQQRAGPEALSPRAHRRQPRRLLLGPGPDAGVKHTLGDRVCTFCIKAIAIRSSSASGKNHVNSSWAQWEGIEVSTRNILMKNCEAPHFFTRTVMEKKILIASLPWSFPRIPLPRISVTTEGDFLIFTWKCCLSNFSA